MKFMVQKGARYNFSPSLELKWPWALERFPKTKVRLTLSQVIYFFFGVCSALKGQNLPKDSIQVTITATRFELPHQEAAYRITQLRAEDLRFAAQLSDVLARKTGANLRTYGLTGSSTATMRGASSAQTLVLWDGFRMTNPQLGVTDLSLLPIVGLESVEVLHGAASALHGSEAVGGTLQLRTERPILHGWEAQSRSKVGAFGARSQFLTWTQGAETGFFRIAGQFGRLTGDFPYQNPAFIPPRTETRLGADRQDRMIWGSGGRTSQHHQIQMAVWHAEVSRGIAGPMGSSLQGERQWDRSTRLWATDQFTWAKTPFQSGLMWHQTTLRYLNPVLKLDESGKAEGYAAYIQAHPFAQRFAQRQQTLLFGLQTEATRVQHPQLQTGATERQTALFATAMLPQAQWRLFPTFRLEVRTDPNPKAISPAWIALPSLGLNRKISTGWHLKAGINRVFRQPSFNDRYWQPGGNPALKPEMGWHLDAGSAWEKDHTTLELSFFGHRLKDQIVWQPNAQGIWSPRNIQRTQAYGTELSFHTQSKRWQGQFHTDFFGSLLRSEDLSNPESSAYRKQLRYQPRFQAKGELAWKTSLWELALNGFGAGKRFTTQDESRSLAPYFQTDLRLLWFFRRSSVQGHVSLVGMNLTNATYQIMENYPMPPRHLNLELNLVFKKLKPNKNETN